MTTVEILRLLLRLTHALAAALWLGGGAYYVMALRPQLRDADPARLAMAREAQRAFGEWASTLTLVMIVTGVILVYDRLTDGQGTLVYVVVLGVKIVAALAAFWLTGAFTRRVTSRRQPARTGRAARINRSLLVLLLGGTAFVLGVALAASYPSGIGQR
ncbi:MAG TPA: hypothetical protein VFI42_17040 [Thermomicrobiaceae bacterium]|nr:hypothetical protein [Thermomicrobiaceae bacterium]